MHYFPSHCRQTILLGDSLEACQPSIEDTASPPPQRQHLKPIWIVMGDLIHMTGHLKWVSKEERKKKPGDKERMASIEPTCAGR